MRTTLNLDPQLVNTAKRLAAARSVALGDIISELANIGLDAQSQAITAHKNSFPVFKIPSGTPMIGLEDVKMDED